MNLSLFIAKRYLISKKSNHAINVISWISIIAISLTTAALVIVLSAMNGMTGIVADLFNAIEPDLKITSVNSKYILNRADIDHKIKLIPEINTVSYSLEENALIKLDDKQAVVNIKGVDSNFKSLTRFDTVVKEGEYRFEYNNQFYGVFGQGIANKLGINVNDFISPISIFAPKRGKFEGINPDDAFTKINVSPAGIFSLNDDFDYKYVLIDLKAAQSLFDCSDEVSMIEINVKDKSNIDKIQLQLKDSLGENYSVKNKYEANDVLFKTLEIEKLWVFLILSFILIIATFNIIGSLTMLIMEKKKDIKTFYNMGADQQFIKSIFMKEGLLITFVGAISGLIIGLGVCIIQQQFHLISFDDQSVISYYPIQIKYKDIISILGVVMLIGFLAAIYPVKVFTKNNLLQQ